MTDWVAVILFALAICVPYAVARRYDRARDREYDARLEYRRKTLEAYDTLIKEGMDPWLFEDTGVPWREPQADKVSDEIDRPEPRPEGAKTPITVSTIAANAITAGNIRTDNIRAKRELTCIHGRRVYRQERHGGQNVAVWLCPEPTRSSRCAPSWGEFEFVKSGPNGIVPLGTRTYESTPPYRVKTIPRRPLAIERVGPDGSIETLRSI